MYEATTTKEKVIEGLKIGGAELLGTAMLVFFGCGCMLSSLAGYTISVLQIVIIFGFAVVICVQTFAHISGGHVNPVVSITSLCLGIMPLWIFPVYIVAQVIGAILGFAVLKAITPSKYFNAKEIYDAYLNQKITLPHCLCSTVPNPNVHVVQALAMEFIMSFTLGIMCCAIWDSKNANKHDSLAIKFGLLISCVAAVGAPYSGGSLNPARSFGPALINWEWTGHWIYWIGPILGAVAAGIPYRYIWQTKATIPE